MKKLIAGLGACILCLAPAFTLLAEEPETAARVDGVVITKAELDRNLKQYLSKRGIPGGHAEKGGKVEQFRKDLLENMIGFELLWQEAQRQKLVATDQEVDEMIGNYFRSKEQMAGFLASQGMTEENLRLNFRKNLSLQKLLETISRTLTVGDAEVGKKYKENLERYKVPDQVRARHILVKVEKDADEATRKAAREKAEAILKEIRGGGDFSAQAKAVSDCPSKMEGGDLGFFTRDQMVQPFAEAAFALKPGEVSGVVETEFGYHLIKAEESKPAHTLTQEEVAEDIRSEIRNTMLAQAVKDRTAALRTKAKVEILLP
jgi:peptidyl-prolyl cis-trans isomerase C